MACIPIADYTLEELHELGVIDDQEFFDEKEKRRAEELDCNGRDVCFDVNPGKSELAEFLEALEQLINTKDK